MINELKPSLFLEEVSEIIDKNFEYSNRVDNILEDWAKNKSFIYNLFKENLIINSDYFEVKGLDNEESIASFEIFRNQVPEYISNYKYLDAFWDFMNECVGLEGFLDNKVMETFTRDYTYGTLDDTITLGFQIPKGMKFSRSFGFFITPESSEVLKSFQDYYSTFTQNTKSKKKGRIYLSIHPFDFLSISDNLNNWGSCHSLDGGDYQAGNLNYMADDVTLVAYYLTEANEQEFEQQLYTFPHNTLWNSKAWRRLIHLKKEDDKMIIVYNKAYPYESNQFLLEADKLLLSYINDVNFYDLTPLDSYIDRDIYPTLNMPYNLSYCDLYRGAKNYVRISHTFDNIFSKEIHHFVEIGAPILCLHCGQHYAIENNTGLCSYCGDYETCDICGEAHPRDYITWIDSENKYVCDTCYSIHYSNCDFCDQTVPKDDIKFNSFFQKNLCDSCEDYYNTRKYDAYLLVDDSYDMWLRNKGTPNFEHNYANYLSLDSIIRTLNFSFVVQYRYNYKVPNSNFRFCHNIVLTDEYPDSGNRDQLIPIQQRFENCEDIPKNLTELTLVGMCYLEDAIKIKNKIEELLPNIKVNIDERFIYNDKREDIGLLIKADLKMELQEAATQRAIVTNNTIAVTATSDSEVYGKYDMTCSDTSIIYFSIVDECIQPITDNF